MTTALIERVDVARSSDTDQSSPVRTPLVDLAACTFIAGRRRMAISHPLAQVGSMLCIVLSHDRYARDEPGHRRSCLRAFRAYLRPDGVTCWDATICCLNIILDTDDLRQRRLPERIAFNPIFASVAFDLLRACEQAQLRADSPPGRPTLPATVMALPLTTHIEPHPTAMVRLHADRHKMRWTSAWHALYEQLRRSDLEARYSQRLIDSRLIDHPVASLEEYHLMQPLMGRSYNNPLRPTQFRYRNRRQREAILHQRLPYFIRAGCARADLIKAAHHPRNHLHASRIAAIQVWRPNWPMALTTVDVFTHLEPGVQANLAPLPYGK